MGCVFQYKEDLMSWTRLTAEFAEGRAEHGAAVIFGNKLTSIC